MKRRWKKADTFVAIIFVICMSALLFLSFVFMKVYFINKEATNIPAITKVSEKGRYFGPFYKATFMDNEGHYITKNQYENENVIPGYKTDVTYYTPLDLVYEGGIFIVFMVALFIICALMLHYFYKGFFRKHINQDWKACLQKIINTALIVYVGISFLLFLYLFWDTTQKILPLGHEETVAQVVDREVEKRYGRYQTNRHYVSVQFTDHKDNEHHVKLQIPYQLYDKYEHDYGIPIHYPKRNPANVYIELQTPEDYLTIIPIRDILILLFLVVSYLYVFDRLYKQEK